LVQQVQDFTDNINSKLKEVGAKTTLDEIKKDPQWKDEYLEILTHIEIKNGDDLEDIFNSIEEYKENEIFVNFNSSTWKSENAKKQSIVNDIKIGDTISDEDFKVLGDAYEDYFELQNDGTYKLIAAAEDLRDAVDAIETKKILDNIKERD